MTRPGTVRVRVLPARAVTVHGHHYTAGAEIELQTEAATALQRQGFVAIREAFEPPQHSLRETRSEALQRRGKRQTDVQLKPNRAKGKKSGCNPA